MEKEFVTYETALALKELGFDEECFKWYHNPDLLTDDEVFLIYNNDNELFAFAPLKQQVFRWFREKYQLECISERSGRWLWYKFEIYELYKDCKLMRCTKLEFTTYEEAENACIEKLIEIAKQQDNE